MNCHEEHSLVELYTKRSFRCDCGTNKGGIPCKIDTANKSDATSTSKNRYNQNFSGTYCTCKRPYPDDDDPVEDEMIQCVICEDWFHTRHLNTKVPDSSTYSEMICEGCVTKNDFLLEYIGLAVQVVDLSESTLDASINIDRNESICEESAAKKIKLAEDACVKPVNPLNDAKPKALFFKDEWRKNLCQCSKCSAMYEEKGTKFLLDSEDTVVHYEEQGKSKPKENFYEASLAALSTLDRVNQIDAITSYNRMKDKLFEFLNTFVVNNQIVTEEDVKRFFRTMKENTDTSTVHQPHFCR